MKIKKLIKHSDKKRFDYKTIKKISKLRINNLKKEHFRANHYHKEDWHYCYVLSGKIKYIYSKINAKKKNVYVVKKGELFFTPLKLFTPCIF